MGLCEDDPSCDNTYNAVMPLSRASTRGRYSRIVGVTTHLRSITNNGTWMLVLVPTYSTKIFVGQTAMTTYVIPFVIGMLLARDSIIGIFILMSLEATSVFPQRGRDDAAQRQ